MKKHLLFICSSAVDRSPAAASLFEGSKKYEAKYAGLNSWASVPLTQTAIDWADVIFVMDEKVQQHRTILLERFPDAIRKSIIVLDVPADYARADPRLKDVLRGKIDEAGFN
ncbi:MAG: protein tyrosine phosphatase [Nanoarchaeota archaeon]